MRLISAPSVTDVTIRSAIYFIPCIRGTATHYSHGLGISLCAHHLETKLEGIRRLNPDRSFDFFVFLTLMYVEVRGENAGSTNETHFGIDRHVGANMPSVHNVNTSESKKKRYEGLGNVTVVFEFVDLLLLVVALWTHADRSRLINPVKLLVSTFQCLKHYQNRPQFGDSFHQI